MPAYITIVLPEQRVQFMYGPTETYDVSVVAAASAWVIAHSGRRTA